MKEKIENELLKLNTYEFICTDALNELQSNKPLQLLEFEKNEIITILKRMFDAEKEYLLEEPNHYFEIDEEADDYIEDLNDEDLKNDENPF